MQSDEALHTGTSKIPRIPSTVFENQTNIVFHAIRLKNSTCLDLVDGLYRKKASFVNDIGTIA